MSIVLRPDQWASVNALGEALQGGAKRVLVQGPTGWGKGSVAAYVLATRAARHGRRSAFVCHREEINLDLAERLRQAGAPSVRLVMGDHAEGDADAAVTVASIQTLDARQGLDALGLGVDLVWWDEAHRCAASSYKRVAARFPDAVHVGSTATPARTDGRALAFFERLIPGPQISELVERELLAPIDVFCADEETDHLTADPLDVLVRGVPTIVFASSLEHSKGLAAGAIARGHRARHVDGETPGDERRATIAGFNAGAVDVLFNYRLLTEGVDLPRAADIVLATKVDSIVAYLQSIGRVRRYRPGKRARLRDLRGSFWTHGGPDLDRSFSLEGRGIVKATNDGSIAQCPTCLAWGPPGRCASCGAERPLRPRKPPRVTKEELRRQAQDAQPRVGADWERWVDVVTRYRVRGWNMRGAALEFHRVTGRFPRWRADQVPLDFPIHLEETIQ